MHNEGYSTRSVCVSDLSLAIVALLATRQPMSDTNGFKMVFFLKRLHSEI